jgi:hypothetical protein
VGGEPGGLCVCAAALETESGIERGCVKAGCNGWIVSVGGVTRVTLDGNVVPFCAQLSTHNNSSSWVNFARLCSNSIALQHSISMLPMLHWLSPKLIGTPANAPPTSTSKRNKDASRDFISTITLLKNGNSRQSLSWARPEVAPRPVKEEGANYWPLFFFMSFMLHESPPQQHSCLPEEASIVVWCAPSFILHESPQQQHASLSALSPVDAWFFMPSFFIWHESPQQQQDALSDDEAWFFMPSFFIISHESPQQLPDTQQHDCLFSLPDGLAFCANAAPVSASVSPSANAGAHRLRQFISISPERKIIAGINEHTDAYIPACAGETELQVDF